MISFQIIKTSLTSLKSLCRQQSIRNYRFGNRVIKSGFYYSPKVVSNDKYLKSEAEECDGIELSPHELRQKRNKLFDNEKRRQSELVTRIEKIEVQVINPLDSKESVTLFMNKNISTPYNCGQHIHHLINERSVLALIDDKHYWDMNRALVSDCTIAFKHFKDVNTFMVNKAFWRSCSFMLGSVIEKAFKDDIKLSLHSWPKPDPNSGSFVYDVVINLNNWKPNTEELNVFSVMMRKLAAEELNFERLECNTSLAKEMFEYNSIKAQQIDSIASSLKKDSVILYRVGDHIDISCGPMISNTSQVGSTHVTAIHEIQTEMGPMFRFQGIAIPKQLNINTFTLSILRERSQKLNHSGLHNYNSSQTSKESLNKKQVLENYQQNNDDVDIKQKFNS